MQSQPKSTREPVQDLERAQQGSRNRRNWLGNVSWQPVGYFQPGSEAEVQELVRQAAAAGCGVRVVGAGHSWSALCETSGFTLNLDRLNRIVEVDREGGRVTVEAGIRLKELCQRLLEHGLALANVGSILEQSLAGVVSTATHGSGIGFGSFSTQVLGLHLVTGSGELLRIDAQENSELLPAVRVSLGALGILTQITLKVVPAFLLREVREPRPFEEVVGELPALIGSADHFKLWWFPHAPVVQLYRQHRLPPGVALPPSSSEGLPFLREDSRVAQTIFRFLLGVGERFPGTLPSIHRFFNAATFKPVDRVGQSFEVFTLAMPPLHHESEYAIPAEAAGPALAALDQLIRSEGHGVNFVSEIRFVARDDAWLSPAYGRDVCYIGGYHAGDRTWQRFLADYEGLMGRYGGRPHWGKEFTLSREALRALYPRWDDFVEVRRALDPDGRFLNPLLSRLFG